MKQQLTYDTLIQELSTKKLTRWNLPGLITKCSDVIDSLGIQRMELFSRGQDFNQIKSQQQKLITIRDHLYRTFIEYDTRDRKHIRSDQAAQEGISTYHALDADDIGTWNI